MEEHTKSRLLSSSLASTSTVQQRADRTEGYPERLGKHSYRLIIGYDGTSYRGWQLQPTVRGPTIQLEIERALTTLLRQPRENLGVGAAGRTDSGVHAEGQVVQFFSDDAEIDEVRFVRKVNALLPHDIRASYMARTAPDFSATFSALGKTYHYYIQTGEVADPLSHRYYMHCRRPLDLVAMRAAGRAMVGTHDFTQFSNVGESGRRRSPIKTLKRVELVAVPYQEGAMRVEVQGDGFLYRMVRHLVGALVAVGEGRLRVEDVQAKLAQGGAGGISGQWRGYNVAPGKGLRLHRVYYPPEVDNPNTLLHPDMPHDDYGRLLSATQGLSAGEDG